MNHRRKDPVHPDWRKGLKGPEGRPACKVCLSDCPKGRRTFCSDQCVERYKIRTGSSAWIRPIVFARDKGVCAACGRPTGDLAERIYRLERIRLSWPHAKQARLSDRLRRRFGRDQWASARLLLRAWLLLRQGWPPRYALNINRSLWDADHTVPLIEGGAAELSNLRTLCLPCHLAETRALRKRMKKEKDASSDRMLDFSTKKRRS